MRRFYGGQAAPRGSYWDLRLWKVEAITKKDQTLPGGPEHLYWHLNFAELILFVLLISIAFVVSLPAIGFALFLYTAGTAVAIFLLQKVLANIGRQECRAEQCACNFAKKRFCKHWDDDNLTMAVRGLFLSLIFLLGGIIARLLPC